MSDCQQCLKLEQENRKLKIRLQRISQVCAYIIGQANRVMSSHQPRGKWAYAKGAKATAETIGKWLHSTREAV